MRLPIVERKENYMGKKLYEVAVWLDDDDGTIVIGNILGTEELMEYLAKCKDFTKVSVKEVL